MYHNQGNFTFEDITIPSGLVVEVDWCTGVTMVDVNTYGFLDIYICRSGLFPAEFRENLLFINNGDLTFTEQARDYGINHPGYSTQSSFFDYDKDSDLDLFIINHSA